MLQYKYEMVQTIHMMNMDNNSDSDSEHSREMKAKWVLKLIERREQSEAVPKAFVERELVSELVARLERVLAGNGFFVEFSYEKCELSGGCSWHIEAIWNDGKREEGSEIHYQRCRIDRANAGLESLVVEFIDDIQPKEVCHMSGGKNNKSGWFATVVDGKIYEDEIKRKRLVDGLLYAVTSELKKFASENPGLRTAREGIDSSFQLYSSCSSKEFMEKYWRKNSAVSKSIRTKVHRRLKARKKLTAELNVNDKKVESILSVSSNPHIKIEEKIVNEGLRNNSILESTNL